MTAWTLSEVARPWTVSIGGSFEAAGPHRAAPGHHGAGDRRVPRRRLRREYFGKRKAGGDAARHQNGASTGPVAT